MQRCAHMDATALHLLHRGEHQRAAAHIVQGLKAKLQCCLNSGDWQQAWLLTGLADPVATRPFAGGESEMSAVARYVSAMHDLRTKTRLRQNVSPPPVDPEEVVQQDGGGAQGRGGRNRKKGGLGRGQGDDAVDG